MQTYRCISFLTLITVACLPFATIGESQTKSKSVATTKQATLARTDYGVAEAVFSRFIADLMPKVDNTNIVCFLAYGPSDSDLPADFFTRFQPHPVVITNASASEIRQIVRGGQSETILAERKGAREGVAIALRELTVTKDTAVATVKTLHSGITIVTWKVRLKLEGKAWKVIERITESIACSG